ncbi:MAG TPA: MarP family serine protease [Solirubrobacteraceae bacterium]|nr:MarP family serine protease [Solirubrobacteraceae bacterium]
MTAIDIIIIILAVFFALIGFARGFLIGALSLVGFIGGAYLGTRFGPHLLEEGNASPFAPLFGLLGALVGGVILSAGAEGIAGAMRSGIRSPVFGVFDGLLGAVLAIALALGLAWLVSVIVLQTPGVREYRGTIQRSVILKELNMVLPSDRVLKALARFDPFPTIKGPAADVSPPRGSVARDPDVEAAGRSIVRVLSNSCGLGVAGSGWVAGRGIVVTNAHVVAGSNRSSVEPNDSGSRLDATAIHFDSRNDLAILRVPALDRPSLQFAREVKRTEPGAVLGFPLNGPFRIVPARVGRTTSVLANDAYGRRRVRREVTTFRADVQPGNSGGPIVDVAGRVSGTVFSKLVASEGGYAVPNAIVRDALAGAGGRVDTGRCIR